MQATSAEVVDVDGDGKAFCKRCCEEFKDNGGHGNLHNHIITKHEEYKQVLLEHRRLEASGGAMNRFVVKKSISRDARSIHGWIEWIVLADLPVTIVQNEYYVKYSRNTLKPTTYKTVTKYMERLEKLVRRDIARELPPTFGLVFDGWSCDGEHLSVCCVDS